MRTKALLLAAVFGVVGLATSFAQVYSVNAVGYVNVKLYPGYNLIANPLQGTSALVSQLINPAALVDEMAVFKFDNATQGYLLGNYSEILGGWDFPNGEFSVAPGEGMFVLIPGTATKTNTFVGEVLQGTLTTPLVGGQGKFNMVSSKVPQTGKLVTDLGWPVADEDTVFLYDPMHDGTGYQKGTFNYSEILGGWDPAEPTIEVGQAFFGVKGANATWTRTFSVN